MFKLDPFCSNIKARLEMNTIRLLILCTILLSSCRGLTQGTAITPAAGVTASAAGTRTSVPAPLFTITPPPSPLPTAGSSLPVSERIVYYYFVKAAGGTFPDGSVVVMQNMYVLAPEPSAAAQTRDPVTDLRTALQSVLTDERNIWDGSKLEIIKITFDGGHVDIILQGEYFGVAPVTLGAARMQILLTVFANTAVQTVAVTLNGDTFANIDVSSSRDAKPADHVFTRAEVETFISENLYVSP